jgi:hypothetical protein
MIESRVVKTYDPTLVGDKRPRIGEHFHGSFPRHHGSAGDETDDERPHHGLCSIDAAPRQPGSGITTIRFVPVPAAELSVDSAESEARTWAFRSNCDGVAARCSGGSTL